MLMFSSFLLLSIAYVFGSIPSGYLLSKFVYHQNVAIIDGNMGTKYIWRNLGLKASVTTFGMDFLKGYLPLWTTLQLLPNQLWLHCTVIIGVILGHNFSLFLHFKGGKGIASSFGCFALYPAFLPLMILCQYLANELTKKSAIYGGLPLMVLAFATYDPYKAFITVPFPIKIAAMLTIFLFIVKTYDDPFFLQMRHEAAAKVAGNKVARG